jgi:hypothetical protein
MRNTPSILEKLTSSTKKYLQRATLGTALALAGCGGNSGTESEGNNEGETPTTQNAEVKEYKNSFGYFLPDNGKEEEISNELENLTIQLGANELIQYGLGTLPSWTNIVSTIINEIPSQGSQQPSHSYFVKTENSDWVKYITVCPDEEILTSLIYTPGSDYQEHWNGLEVEINDGLTKLDNVILLEKNEELGIAPDFLVSKNPLSLSNYVDYTLPIEQVFNIGKFGDKATVFVDLTENCVSQQEPPQGNQDTEPNNSFETATPIKFSNGLAVVEGDVESNCGDADANDFYTFPVSSGDEITIYAKRFGSGCGGITSYSGPSKEEGIEDFSNLCSSTPGFPYEEYTLDPVVVSKTGEYFVRAWAYCDHSLDYKLEIKKN